MKEKKMSVASTSECACVDDSGNLWFMSGRFNGLFCMDTLGHLKYMATVDREPFLGSDLYRGAIFFQGKIYMFPAAACDIAVYNIAEKSMSYIVMKNSIKKSGFNYVYISSDQILLYPVSYSTQAYLLSLEDCRLQKIDIKYEKNKMLRNETEMFVFGSAFCNGKAYFAVYDKDYFLSFDVRTGKAVFFPTWQGQSGYRAVTDNESIYLSSADAKVNRYDLDGKYIDTYHFSGNKKDDLAAEKNPHYVYLEVIGDEIIGIPERQGNIVVIEKNLNNTYTIEQDWNEIGVGKREDRLFGMVVRNGSLLYQFPYVVNKLLRINLEKREIDYLDADLSYEEIIRIYHKEAHNRCKAPILFECKLPLDLFVELIQTREKLPESNYNLNIGRHIFGSIMKRN